MNSLNEMFNAQEKLILTLRSLYEGFGYSRFPMRRFEEYALYLENKSFLKSESVLAFTNANGKLMALRPDVTLSIVKHVDTHPDQAEKLYYIESVYRVSQTDHEFAEIEQMGVEMLGAVDEYGMAEVLVLALKSLEATGKEYVLEIGHMGFAGGLMGETELREAEKEALFSLIRQKNIHELRRRLEGMPVSPAQVESILGLAGLAGSFDAALEQARGMALNTEMRMAVEELSRMYETFQALGLSDRLRLDFSILNDLTYYNGLVFHGYVEGVPRVALSGGRYDHLLGKLGKDGCGIGFALYLDELLPLLAEPESHDADVLVIYEKECDMGALWRALEPLREQGLRVLAAPADMEGVRRRKTLRFVGKEFLEVSPC